MIRAFLVASALTACYRPGIEHSCTVRCVGDAQCTDGFRCEAGLCRDPDGQACSGDTDPDASLLDTPPGCVGRDLYTYCPAILPVSDRTLPSTSIDTTAGSANCDPDVLEYCVVAARRLVVMGDIIAHGSRPLVLVGVQSLQIAAAALVDASSSGTKPGAGSDPSACGMGTVGTTIGNASGGGAGGTFGGSGGRGGAAGMDSTSGMPAGGAGSSVTVIRGGCRGSSGGGLMPGGGGLAGGAVALISGGMLTIDGVVRSAGSGGGGGDRYVDVSTGMTFGSGGGGGGSGGLIALDGDFVMVTGLVLAGGGGGGGGAAASSPGGTGQEMSETGMVAVGGTGAINAGDGGTGGGTVVAGEPGGDTAEDGGGGGGGGAGVIRIRATTSTLPGLIVPPPS